MGGRDLGGFGGGAGSGLSRSTGHDDDVNYKPGLSREGIGTEPQGEHVSGWAVRGQLPAKDCLSFAGALIVRPESSLHQG